MVLVTVFHSFNFKSLKIFNFLSNFDRLHVRNCRLRVILVVRTMVYVNRIKVKGELFRCHREFWLLER